MWETLSSQIFWEEKTLIFSSRWFLVSKISKCLCDLVIKHFGFHLVSPVELYMCDLVYITSHSWTLVFLAVMCSWHRITQRLSKSVNVKWSHSLSKLCKCIAKIFYSWFLSKYLSMRSLVHFLKTLKTELSLFTIIKMKTPFFNVWPLIVFKLSLPLPLLLHNRTDL